MILPFGNFQITLGNIMKHTISLPNRRAVRVAIGVNVTAWARRHGHSPAAVHNTIKRYADGQVDMTRIWGEQTRGILLDLHAAVSAHESHAA